MPLAVIPGSYRVVGASPDGDSVRFTPTDPTAFSRAGVRAAVNANGSTQLRLDAIDALETHYTPPHGGHTWRQPEQLGGAASARLLELLGFTSVTRGANGIVSASTPETVPGYVLTRAADQYGRVISLVYGGERDPSSGAVGATGTAHVDVAELQRSANHALLQEGLVYPTFYSSLYVEFRTELAAVAVGARAAGTGVWEHDVTTSGFTLTSEQQLTDDVVILPKLFRRLAEYLSDAAGAVDLSGFRAFLATHGDDQLFTVPEGQATGLDTLVAVDGQDVRLTVPPERLVFLES